MTILVYLFCKVAFRLRYFQKNGSNNDKYDPIFSKASFNLQDFWSLGLRTVIQFFRASEVSLFFVCPAVHFGKTYVFTNSTSEKLRTLSSHERIKACFYEHIFE